MVFVGKYIPLCTDVEEALADLITLDDDEPMDVADSASKETQSAGQKAETPEIADDEEPEERVTTPGVITPEIVEVEEALAEALDDIEQVLYVQEVLSILYS